MKIFKKQNRDAMYANVQTSRDGDDIKYREIKSGRKLAAIISITMLALLIPLFLIVGWLNGWFIGIGVVYIIIIKCMHSFLEEMAKKRAEKRYWNWWHSLDDYSDWRKKYGYRWWY